jgi:hypothetical protein
MKTITSVSGGRTSAYLAAKYPSDYLLFALVRIEDENCRFPDGKISREIEDRIQAPFIGTAEDDKIIYTMLDLEQYLGQKIHWVTGMTYDEYIQKINGGYTPNIDWRGCTTHLKLIPMAQWWLCNVGEPVLMQIGYRANETERANRSLAKLNENGLSELKIPIAHKRIKRGWQNINNVVAWQRPTFKLIEDGIFRQDIDKFWIDKPVRFADYNNCVGCFHRSPLFLAKMYDIHPNKMGWFEGKETKGTWKKDIRYEEIKKFKIQRALSFEDLGGCASGYCEVA